MTFFIENISIYYDNDNTEWLIYGKYIKVNIDSQIVRCWRTAACRLELSMVSPEPSILWWRGTSIRVSRLTIIKSTYTTGNSCGVIYFTQNFKPLWRVFSCEDIYTVRNSLMESCIMMTCNVLEAILWKLSCTFWVISNWDARRRFK